MPSKDRMDAVLALFLIAIVFVAMWAVIASLGEEITLPFFD